MGEIEKFALRSGAQARRSIRTRLVHVWLRIRPGALFATLLHRVFRNVVRQIGARSDHPATERRRESGIWHVQ